MWWCPREIFGAVGGDNGNVNDDVNQGNVNNARLKSKSRRPLQIQMQRQRQIQMQRQRQIQMQRQRQRRPAEAGRYKFKILGAHYHGTCLIQPSQMDRERARARMTAQVSRDRAGDGFVGLSLRLGASAICDSPLLRLLRNFVV